MTFCLLVCQMCGKGTFSQIRSHMFFPQRSHKRKRKTSLVFAQQVYYVF